MWQTYGQNVANLWPKPGKGLPGLATGIGHASTFSLKGLPLPPPAISARIDSGKAARTRSDFVFSYSGWSLSHLLKETSKPFASMSALTKYTATSFGQGTGFPSRRK